MGSVSGIFVKNLVKSLAKSALVTVVTPGDDQKILISKDAPEELVICHYAPRKFQTLAHKPGGIPARMRNNRLSILLVPLLMLSMLLNIVIRARDYDVIHCNWAVSGFMVSLLRWFIKIPIATTLRGEDVNKSASKLSLQMLKKCLKASDKVILVSTEMRDELIKLFPQYKSKLHVIHNGVDSMFLESDVAVNTHKDKKTVLRMITVASLIPRKNVSFILSALEICQKRGLDFEFVVIGEGEEYSKLIAFSERARMSKSVKFLGQLGPEAVARELSKSPIFITSSHHEGRPNVVVEAMAAGACVLASDISGHRELIKDTGAGLIFDLKKAEDLTDLLCDLASSPTKIKLLGNKARNYVVENGLTWDYCADNYRLLFESLQSDR